jgi:cytochrome c oxidase subunit II
VGPPFSPHSPQAQVIATLFAHFLILAAAIFVIVAGLVVYGVLRFRSRAEAVEPPQIFGSRRFEIAWTLIPLVIVAILFIVTLRAMALIDAPQRADRTPDLVITGHQWWWEARYPNGAAIAGEIHIPVSRRLLVRVESADVIHDFWVPQLARKIDAVPGLASYIWLEADSPGTFQGRCSEFCGAQHAWMQFVVVAETEAAFSAWLSRQSEPALAPSNEPAAEGARLFVEKKCADCHGISGAGAKSLSGPDLTHVATREFLGAGISRNVPEVMALWVTNPQIAKPGNRMPDARLSNDEARALTAYLETLR